MITARGIVTVVRKDCANNEVGPFGIDGQESEGGIIGFKQDGNPAPITCPRPSLYNVMMIK